MPVITFSAAESGYDVFADGEHIGYVWKRPGRSFSGAWTGVHVNGRSTSSFCHTRNEAVAGLLRLEDRRPA